MKVLKEMDKTYILERYQMNDPNKLELFRESFTIIKSNAFEFDNGLNLKAIVLKETQLNVIETDSFKGLTNLKSLEIERSNLTRINENYKV